MRAWGPASQLPWPPAPRLAVRAAPSRCIMVFLALVVIALAIFAIYRGLEVRLTLFLAAAVLGIMAGNPQIILQTFFTTFTNEKFVVPICAAMGFAYVLRHTGCDQHLVHLLVRPLTRVRFLLLPGTVVVGFLVNMPVVSQTSTVVTIGPVVIPILLAARFSPLVIGAALLLGSSIGGELFNPGAPELRTTIVESQKAADLIQRGDLILDSQHCIQRILPLNILGLVLATGVLWWWSIKQDRDVAMPTSGVTALDEASFVINPLKAMVPLVPLLLLYLAAPPFEVLQVPLDWLEDLPKGQAPAGRFESRLIGTAMLAGVAVAALATWSRAGGVAAAFFEGAGYGFANIVSLIVTATCFGKGIEIVGLAQALGDLIQLMPGLLIPAAGLFSLGFAILCGSGMATAQSLFPFFAGSALQSDIDPLHVGAVVSLAAAAGRTMSPVAAVTLMTARLTDTNPFQLSKAVAWPLLISTTAIILAALIFAPAP